MDDDNYYQLANFQ